MTRQIITVGVHEAIGDLERLMQRFRFRHLPVVDAENRLVGLISLSDLLHAKLGTLPDGTPTEKADEKTTAEAIMRKIVVVARVDSPLTTACEVMVKEKIACLPVALEDGTLVGIVTMSDVVRLAHALLVAQS
jgi:CBS domain-containing protein